MACFSTAFFHASASSIVRSGVITPEPPEFLSSSANFSTPYLSMGFQYVITTTGTPRAATAFTVAKTSSAPVPFFKDKSAVASDPQDSKEASSTETNTAPPSKAVDWEMDDYHIQRLKEIGIWEEDRDESEDPYSLVSRQ